MTLITLLIAFGCFQAYFIALALQFKNRNMKKLLFSILLLTEGLGLLNRLFIETGLIYSFPHLLGISYPFAFAKGPLLFLFALSITNDNFRFKPIYISFFTPVILLIGLNSQLYFLSAENKINILSKGGEVATISYNSGSFIIGLFYFIYLGVFIWLSLKKLNSNISFKKNNRTAKWFRMVIIYFSLFMFIGFLYLIQFPLNLVNYSQFNNILMLVMTFLIQSLAYSLFDFENSSIFSKSKKLLIPKEELKVHKTHIMKLLENDKLYLNDEFNVEDFAKILAWSKRKTSEVIGQAFGGSFKDLVNGYRVKEALKIMEMERGNKIHMIDICFDSGFNNKVNFYRVFKKNTGYSPLAYFQNIDLHSPIITSAKVK